MSRSPLTRRKLGKLALGSAAMLQAQSDSKYASALDGLENRVDVTRFDPVAHTRTRHSAAPLRLTFRAAHRKDPADWQKQLRVKVTELIGGLPPKLPAVSSQTLEVRDFPGYRREKFAFEGASGLVLGYLLTPKTGRPRYPAVVCLPGHGRGVDDIVGIDEHGRDRTVKEGYAYDYAIQVVEHGMAAVAIELMAFGCRRDAISATKGLTANACQPVAGSALLLGETMVAWRVWDVMRTIDWIARRPELDAARVGCLGCSGGGAITLFAAALDSRIKAALVSSYLNTFRDSIMSVSHCIDNYVPGILNWAEMYDVAGLIAPRPLFAESGDQDHIFPVAASRQSFAAVKNIYAAFHADDRVAHEVFNGPHSFWGKGGLPFLARQLS